MALPADSTGIVDEYQMVATGGTAVAEDVMNNVMSGESIMREFLRPLRAWLERVERTVEFANTGNLEEALRLMRERRLEETGLRAAAARKRHARRLMSRPLAEKRARRFVSRLAEATHTLSGAH